MNLLIYTKRESTTFELTGATFETSEALAPPRISRQGDRLPVLHTSLVCRGKRAHCQFNLRTTEVVQGKIDALWVLVRAWQSQVSHIYLEGNHTPLR